ncbi:SRPBCC family protein [Pedococcus sp. 5OH_020]|uniref:SRPBCC family protein n=1 Tax=Pedococcus sp. 5OH_020 TaxID=2989814 RepID=UPI0022E9DC6F|nr:SRPBCC family protein [Pedococcus sp. 5OH_020]
MAPSEGSSMSGLASQLPLGRLKSEAASFGEALAHRGIDKVGSSIGSVADRLTNVSSGASTGGAMAKNMAQGDSPLAAGAKATAEKVTDKVKGAFGNLGGGGGGKKLKVTNILESVDVPLSREKAYQQWTQFEDFPTFMKKVEHVSQEEDEKVKWKAQIFWSHRTWDANIIDQVPNERIVWKSQGPKGHVDGAVTFHELAPNLTRILMVLEYHPKGLFEHTGNIWRAQGRRARLEFKHFARHASTHTLIHQDEVQGWPGEIHEGHVTDPDPAASSGEDQGSEQNDEGGQDEGQRGQDSAGEGRKPQGKDSGGQSGSGDKPQGKDSGGQSGSGDKPQGKDSGGQSGSGGKPPMKRGSGQRPASRPQSSSSRPAQKPSGRERTNANASNES